MVQTELNQREILEKDFSSKLRGYDPQEVDEFLDTIIRDYKAYDSHIEDLQSENERISKSVNNMYKRLEAAMKKNEVLNKQIEKLQRDLKQKGGTNAGATASQTTPKNDEDKSVNNEDDHGKTRVIKSPIAIKSPINSPSKSVKVSSTDQKASKTQARPSVTILDLLKRVSNLERAVFGDKMNESDE